MNEVRKIVAEMLHEPAPPMRSADEMLGVARSARQRRSWLIASGAGGAALTTIGVAAVLIVPALRQPPIETPWPAVTLAAPYQHAAPPARAAPTLGDRMSLLLVAAVPDRFTARPMQSFSEDDTVYPIDAITPTDGRTRLLAGAIVRVDLGEREGQLFAYLVHDGRRVPDGNICAGDLLPAVGVVESCSVVDVGGVPIRVVSGVDEERGQVVEATRFLNGGRLTVTAWQGLPVLPPGPVASFALADPGPDRDYVWRRPSLPGPLLSVDELATLAASPSMLS